MAGKRRKKQPRGRQPVRATPAPSVAPVADAGDLGAVVTQPRPAPPTTAGRPATASRYAASVTAPRRGGTVATNTGTIDIDERVPYFSKDLRRILFTAVLMVGAIIAASLVLH